MNRRSLLKRVAALVVGGAVAPLVVPKDAAAQQIAVDAVQTQGEIANDHDYALELTLLYERGLMSHADAMELLRGEVHITDSVVS